MSNDSNQYSQSGNWETLVQPDSDSDESIVQSRRRKKISTFVSEGETSDEESDVPRCIVRRQNHRVSTVEESDSNTSNSDDSKYVSSQTSESQSDWSSSSEVEKQSPVRRKILGKSRTKKPPKIVSETDTDSSDEEVEKCPICLLPFRRQELGTPSSCEHCFCLDCLIEWSKNINTCPVDRQTYTVIHVRDKLGGQIVRCVPVQVAPRVEENLDDLTFCEVCHHCDREDHMLLCDGCDCGYHLECLTPPLSEVPIEEWFCPECSQNSQSDAEAVEIDMDEISDLMEEARRLGVSYGRTRTILQESHPRIVPRTRHTERVRATIRRRNRLDDNAQLSRQLINDPSQPSTSSGFETLGDNSQSRSPSNASNSLGSGERYCSKKHPRKSRRSRNSSSESSDLSISRKSRRRINDKTNSRHSDKSKTKRKSTTSKKSTGGSRKSRTRNNSTKTGRSRKNSNRGTVLREVRITERNEDGEEEEIVTYVKVSTVSAVRSRRRRTKRRKRRCHRRRARTVSSVLLNSKKRLARSLGICKPVKGASQLIPTVKNRTTGERSALTISRHNAGISRLSLFGDGLNLDYSPPGSDTEDYHATGPTITIQRHSVISARRHMRLKTVVTPQQAQIDLLSSIINDQEIWHSNNTNSVALKAEGLVLLKKKEDPGDLKKEKSEENSLRKMEETESVVEHRVSTIDVPLEVSRINPESITQAPMYNNPCGGGNRGNFRGGYRDNTRHSHGGQNYGRDSLGGGGRHSYGGGGGNFGRDFGPPPFYNPNFEHCGPPGPPLFGGNPPFRNRNPQHFRNERFRFMPPMRPQFNFAEGFSEHPFPERFNRPRSPQPPVDRPQNNMPPNLPEDTPRIDTVDQQPQDAENSTVRQEEDCDIYCDIETKSDGELQDQQNGSMALLPPPEPPSGLLDFEENSRSDKDSDQELVIDDSQKEDTPKNDKYDPFSVDSDTDSETKKNDEVSEEKVEEQPVQCTKQPETTTPGTSVRLPAYEDEDDEDSQADCPNFSIYSSQTIDVARHTQQQLSQQIGPLEPPPLPPSIPDDDDVIVGDVQACDLADIPEPSDPYVEALRKERRTLSKIPPKKISHDSRGKITFKIGTKLKINNRLLGLQEEEKENNDEKKKEAEPARDEETSVDREEERMKIAKSRFEEEMQLKAEKEDSGEPMISADSLKEDDTNEEEKEEECMPPKHEGVEKDGSVVVPSEVTESLDKKVENELSSECLSDEGSETFALLRKTPKTDIEEEDSKDVSKIEEAHDEMKMKEPRDFDSDKDDKDGKEQQHVVDEEEEDEDDEEDDEEDEEEEEERFPIEKEKSSKKVIEEDDKNTWDSDGAYTPCKDELPLRESKSSEHLPPIESGLEPITPTKDKPDDLDSCRTPVDYTVLGTEAISETDEAMNFEDELTLLSLRKEKEMEDGEIVEEKNVKEGEKADKEKEDEKKRKKKEKKEKSKDTEKNKENIASENQVAWKKLSKSTKERSYRDKEKRSKSKEKEKEKPKKKKEVVKKKEKRKELPRYDVRKIVAERPSRPRKDEYGRDIREKSRQRSRSRSCTSSKRSRSYSKIRSRSRSRTRLQRSWSRDRRSYSKSLSRRRSLSRSRRKSPKRRSTSRRRSSSRKRSLSRRRSRSVSRKRRSLSRRRSRRSISRSRRSLSRSRQKRSVSRSRKSLSRSRDRRKDKKKYKSRSRSRNRKRTRSKSPRKSSKSRERKHSKRKVQSRSRSKGRSCSRNWEQVEKVVEPEFPREREERESWSAQWTPSWSRSRSKTPPHVQQEPIASREWSPILDDVSVPPKNLTVILTNKEAIKKKKKERRKESKKAKDEKKRKAKRNRTPPPSKEVFASGDNILVSVCFNKDNETDQAPVPELPETIPLIPPLKRRRRESLQTDPPKRSKKEKSKDKRSKSPKPKKDKKKKSKAAEIAATKKPVAVIDLDQSPFREQTPSPRDVIVLSDDDDKQIQQNTPDQCQPSQNSPLREQFISQGPKTPPEPQIKFSINKQASNLRPSMLNPLLDEEEEEEMDERVEEELEMRAQEELELRLKIGPNTPPEPPTSPPTSPDAYDPFDPTKSRSPTPDASQEANSGDERRRSPRKHDSVDGNILEEENMQSQDRQSQEKQVEKPKIISMVTIKRASPQRDDMNENESNKDTAASTGSLEAQQNQQNIQNQSNPFGVMNPVLATVAAAVQRSGAFNASNSTSSQRNLLQSNRISPSNQQKQRSGDRSQAPPVFANSGKSSRSSKSGQAKTNGQNGNDAGAETTDNVDMSSPYSPGSTLSDGMFDPPSPTNFNNSPGASGPGTATSGPAGGSQPTKNSNPKAGKATEKKDAFDALFNAPPPTKTASKSNRNKKVEKDKKKKSTNPKVGVRMDENQLQILDDLPSSAVEMQVKDKFLKKLNRQERVVEEVKLVLKPHYTKKHVTKEEYKDIMRKAVPKICHNKTGEINPKKIAHLIEAYVKKCRSSKKKPTESSSAKAPKPAKVLWS
ncbi:serine/arginine repetitive matrix protein 2-like isoform X2 [Ceratina calcarata]|uniref:Serine/arginine repetitive matrix protein 2-like isoform X2 n=1 Tax=Ceratina calcarata TaxID=156304 RepID=A0AAJ7J3Z6_9HYME|nr:serine/arginine repetitive matrix protein 2-like isoform X2 [Ceratina calcarata]